MAKFIAPEAEPRMRSVSHGTATKAFSRFWNWMDANQTGLGSFSTDQCVERALARLQALRAETEKYIAKQPDNLHRSQCEACLAQLDRVMGRRPSARV